MTRNDLQTSTMERMRDFSEEKPLIMCTTDYKIHVAAVSIPNGYHCDLDYSSPTNHIAGKGVEETEMHNIVM